MLGQNFAFLAYDNCRDLVNFEKKSIDLVLPIQKFLSLVLLRNAIIFQYLVIQSVLHYLSSGPLREVKNKRKFQTINNRRFDYSFSCLFLQTLHHATKCPK